jgi:hypothetical protein
MSSEIRKLRCFGCGFDGIKKFWCRELILLSADRFVLVKKPEIFTTLCCRTAIISNLSVAVVTIITAYFNFQNPCFFHQTVCVSYTVILTVSSDIFRTQHLVFLIETMCVYCEVVKSDY